MQNKPNLISQFSIPNSQFSSLRLRNKPIYPANPINPVKNIILRNEPISESRRSFQLRVNQPPPPRIPHFCPFPFTFILVYQTNPISPSRLCRITSPRAFPRHKSGPHPAKRTQFSKCRLPETGCPFTITLI